MYFKHPTIAAIATALLHQHASAFAGVSIGILEDGDPFQNVAWVTGADVCGDRSFLSYQPDNPCGVKFTLDNGQSYILEGCGGPLSITDGNGNFLSDCEFINSVNHQCGFATVKSTVDC